METEIMSILIVVGVIIGVAAMCMHKLKVTLKKEIVDPEINLLKENLSHREDIIKEQQIRQDARICKVEKRLEEMEIVQNEKFDTIITKLGEIADKNANMSGKMELLLDRLIPPKN
jgi:hypothetical protein